MLRILDLSGSVTLCSSVCFFFQAEDGIRDLVRSRGLGDVYKRQRPDNLHRPFIDALTRPNPDDPTGQSTMRRVTDVLSLIHI